MWSSCLTVLVIALTFANAQQNLDDLINNVFKPGGNDPISEDLTPSNRNPNLQPGGGGGGGIPGTGHCNCVPFYLCNNGSVNTNGEGIINIREKEGPCESYIDICCNKEDATDVPLTPTPPTTRRTGCGFRNPDGVGFRITGDSDNESQFGEFPWMVAILREESVEGNPQKLNVYQCGGALIHPQAVLTAAHCVSDHSKHFKIRAGEWDTQTRKELYPHQDRDVASVVLHPEYYAGALFNDVAILFLESPVDVGDNVNVVCLPAQGESVDHSRCFATGWGKDTFGKEGKYQVILKKIDLPVIPRETCQTQLRKTRLGSRFQLHSSFICAGGEVGKDTCKGDGGSPLVCPVAGQVERYVHAGIVAWGIRCGDKDVPGVYGAVAQFRTWIDEQMELNNLDTTYYQV